MPANTSVWVFEQLGGDRKKLELSDHCAPHGRPRKKPVVETELQQRNSKVRYAGTTAPTRHLFGTMENAQKIDGRLSDSQGGKDFARVKRLEIESFVRDGQQCTVTWDDLISCLCFIERVKFGVESGGEMTYEIEYEVDKNLLDDDLGTLVITPRGPQDITFLMLRAIADMADLTDVPGLRGSLFDSISSGIASITSVSAELNRVAGQIDSFANAPFQLMNQFRAGLDQFRTAVTSLRKTYDDLQVNIALENENAANQQAFWDEQSAWAASSLEAIRLAIEADRAAAVAQRGSILALHTATEGETWEQISRVAYNGSSDRADDIRNANGVAPGANPVPGTTYMVPV